MQAKQYFSESVDLWTLSIIRNYKWLEISSGKGAPNLLGHLQKANLNHWTIFLLRFACQ
jgi:hypothetical protein